MPFKNLTCLSSPEEGHKGRLPPSEENMQLVPVEKPPDIPENEKGISTVLLQKADGVGMGLTVSGGLDKGDRPKISNLRLSGIAAMSDRLQTGDYIASVNGIKTGRMKHAEIISLLKNVGQSVSLEIEYQLPPTNVATPTIAQKTIDITLTKEDNGFGIILRGGHNEDNTKTRSLVVTHIRPGSAAEKDGTIKTGDRLKCINGIHLFEATLDDVYDMIKGAQDTATFTIEYDVSVMDAVNNASGPLLVEISKTPGSNLGLVLTVSLRRKKRVICIDKILPASIADRCGALRVGDQLLSIDGVSLDANNTSVEDASKMLQSNSDHVRIEILPMSQLAIEAPKNMNFRSRYAPTITSAQSLSALNHFPRHPRSHRSLATTTRGSTSTWQRRRMHRPKYAASAISLASVDLRSGNQVVHAESVEICLLSADDNCPIGSTASQYFGIQLQGGVFATEVLTSPPAIAYIEHDSAAERCGRIQVGDRLVSINNCLTENETLDEVKGMLSDAMDNGQVYLEIEFDVAESVVPSSGTFHVKLPKKRDIDLGIIVGRTASPTEPLLITDILPGSIAHRTGTIEAGDKLLSIDGVRLDRNSSVEHAIALLRNAEDVVRLKIKKDEENSDDAETSGAITFTVELKRYGGPLGITISGTEDALDPIIISGLTPGGLAHRTGAIHEGDQILSINNIPLRTKAVSEAIRLLQSAGEIVTLKIRKQPFLDRPIQSNPIPTRPMRASSLQRSSLITEPITEIIDHEAETCDLHHTETAHDTEGSAATNPSYPEPNTSRDAEVIDRVAPAGAPSVDSAVGSLDRTVGSDGKKNSLIINPPVAQAHSTPNSSSQPPPEPAKNLDVPRRIDTLRAKFEREKSPQRYTANRNSHRPDDDKPPRNFAWMERNEDFTEAEHDNVTNSAGVDWQNALHDLQSVGQSTDFMRDFESDLLRKKFEQDYMASIMNTGQLDIADDGFRQRHQRVPSYPRSMNMHTRQTAQSYVSNPTVQLHKITLQKSSDAEDFGFSLSDGQLERGVYVHSTRSNGPADRAGIRPYDRLLQVNGIRTRDFDCCQAIPLIAQSGRRIVLVIARHPHNTGMAFPSHQAPLLAPPMNVPSANVMRSGAFETL